MSTLGNRLRTAIGSFRPLDWLWLFLIVMGLIIRLTLPFIHNPMDFLRSDSLRHFNNAMGIFHQRDSFIDQIGYQLWLALCLRISGFSTVGIGIFTALLSVATPCIWYLWFCEIFSSRTFQLAGFAIIALLPGWVAIYYAFMTETLLLPALGLALWLTWRAQRLQNLPALMLAIFLWCFAVNIKINVLPEAILSTGWLLWGSWQRCGKKATTARAIASLAMLVAAILVNPLMNYRGFGTAWLLPIGGIHAHITRCYLLSGARSCVLQINTNSHPDYVSLPIGGDVQWYPDTLIPFYKWPLPRTGTARVVIERDKGLSLFAPDIPSEWRMRPWYVVENSLIFFFARSWPDSMPRGGLWPKLQEHSRWIWLPIFLFTIILSVKKRSVNFIVILSVVTALCYCFQSYSNTGGRYRKPWEGVAIAALLSLLQTSARQPKRLFRDADMVLAEGTNLSVSAERHDERAENKIEPKQA